MVAGGIGVAALYIGVSKFSSIVHWVWLNSKWEKGRLKSRGKEENHNKDDSFSIFYSKLTFIGFYLNI